MKRIITKWRVLSLPLAALAFSTASSFGATIDLATLLANPGFEGGNQVANGCPVGWTCSPSSPFDPTSYTVTANQYTAGADGLSGGRIVPFGTHAGTAPYPVEGSATLQQLGLGTYAAGNTYTLALWVGTPNKLPSDGSTPVGLVGTISAYFLGTGGGQLQQTSITPSALGQWALVNLSFTPSGAQIGQSIGFKLFVESQPQSGGSGNNRVTDFDIATVPEPSTLALLGLGFVGIGAMRRLRK